MPITLVLDLGNSTRLTWLCIERRSVLNSIGQSLWLRDGVNVINVEAYLWHQRLSRISEMRLNVLAKKDVLIGLKNEDLENHSHCMAGKHNRVSFKRHPPSRK